MTQKKEQVQTKGNYMKSEGDQLQEVLQRIAEYSSTIGAVSTATAPITSEYDQPIIGGQVVLTASQRDEIVRVLLDLADCLKSKKPIGTKAAEPEKARDAGVASYLRADEQASKVTVSAFGNA
jgi:hypothetical protein